MALASGVRMPSQGLSQAELDSLSVFAEDTKAPSSPRDEELLKRKRKKSRISFSAITAEIAVVSADYTSEQPMLGGGLTQEELDTLAVEAPSAASCEPSSPLDSALRHAKRRRSVGDGAAGALARASELASDAAGGAVVAATRAEGIDAGLSQASLDELSAPAADDSDEEEEDSMALRKRRQRAFLSSMLQSPPKTMHGAICSTPPQKKGLCSTPPQKKDLYSTPPRQKGINCSPENKVVGCTTSDAAIQGSPFNSPDLNNALKTPDSGLQKSPASSGTQRSPLGLMNREF